MVIGNVELMHECFPRHSCMRTARMKDKETGQEGNKRGLSMERSNSLVRKKKQAPTAYHSSSKYNNDKYIMVFFCKIWIKNNEI